MSQQVMVGAILTLLYTCRKLGHRRVGPKASQLWVEELGVCSERSGFQLDAKPPCLEEVVRSDLGLERLEGTGEAT